MPGDLEFPLSLDRLHSKSLTGLVEETKIWMKRRNNNCLVHPHGFWVVLLNKSATEEWRFHYWPKGHRFAAGIPGKIHTHDKVVESRIVYGELKNIRYRVKEVEHAEQMIYHVGYDGNRFMRKTTNMLDKTNECVEAVVESEQVLSVGNSYRVEAHTYHEAVVSEDVATATIVCMHSQVVGPIKVVGLASHPDKITFQRFNQPIDKLLELI